ncbi:MAG: hypothetical protein LLG04_18650 [Parachlamydia sp.]|nr:hypothetical protein [Parachlamydia sp.]
MERLEDSSASSPISYARNLAKIYKEFKKSDKQNTDKKILLFVNKSGVLRIFKNSQEAKLQKFEKLNRKDLYKIIKNELVQDHIDQKIAHTAVKALLFLPWSKPFETKTITADFPSISSSISARRNKEVDTMLSNIKTVKRSEEGGNGVIFIESNRELASHSTGMVIKYVKEARLIICADRLLQFMGFVTPKSCFVNDASPLKTKLISKTLDHLPIISVENHEQIKKQTATMRCVLIMTTLRDAISLRQFDSEDIVSLLNNKSILNQLGKMIFIDTFMNNTDRLNVNGCNLGNILIDKNQKLNLIDHEMNVSVFSFESIKSNLKNLLNGSKTGKIIMMLEEALKYDRKKMGPATLSIELKHTMKKGIDEGISQAANDFSKAFDDPTAFNRIFQPYLEESEKIDSKTIIQLIKFVQKMVRS